MKLQYRLLTILSLSICNSLFGQTKYIQTDAGKTIDSLEYVKLKTERVEKIKKAMPTQDIKVTIKDNFKEIRRTADSIIYTYKWDMKIGDAKEKETKSFEQEKYLDKVFQFPSLTALDGKKISIKDLKGKPTLINFWFTTCKPCIEEMPVLSKIKNILKDSANFIAVTYEPTQKTKLFLKKHKYNFIQIANAQTFIDSMNMTSFPVNIFLDKDGIVRKIENGIPYIIDNKKQMKMGDEKEFLKILRELL